MFSSTVLPSFIVSLLSESMSVADEPVKCATMSFASVWNCSFFATKSVSDASSILALEVLRLALYAQMLDGLVEVAVGLFECLLAVHHSGAGRVPEPLDVRG